MMWCRYEWFTHESNYNASVIWRSNSVKGYIRRWEIGNYIELRFYEYDELTQKFLIVDIDLIRK